MNPPHNASRMSLVRSIALAVLALVLPLKDAFAYVDPNIAGWLFQLLFPLFAAVLAVWAFIRNRFVSAWRRFMTLMQGRSMDNDRSPG